MQLLPDSHSHVIVPLVRYAMRDTCPQAQVLRTLDGFEAAVREVETTGIIDGAQWVWNKGIPYLPPELQQRLINDIAQDPLVDQPSAFEIFVGRATLHLATVAGKTQYEVMVALDRQLQANTVTRSMLPTPMYVEYVEGNVHNQNDSNENNNQNNINNNSNITQGNNNNVNNQNNNNVNNQNNNNNVNNQNNNNSVNNQNNNNNVNNQNNNNNVNNQNNNNNVNNQNNNNNIAGVDQFAIERNYCVTKTTLRTLKSHPLNVTPLQRMEAVQEFSQLVKQDAAEFVLVHRQGDAVVRLGEALDMLRYDAHPALNHSFLAKADGVLAQEMQKEMLLIKEMKSPSGFRLQPGAVGPQLEDLKRRLLPLLAIQATAECQRILGKEGPKHVRLNHVRAWLGLPEVDEGPRKGKRGRD